MVCERLCATKLCAKDGVGQRWCVKDCVWQRWCVTKLCVTKWCVKDKVVCERWCVTKMCVEDGVCERCCVRQLCVKDGVWQRCVWKMVCVKDVVWDSCGRCVTKWCVKDGVCDKVVCKSCVRQSSKSATLATQNEGRCRQVPRMPREKKASCHQVPLLPHKDVRGRWCVTCDKDRVCERLCEAKMCDKDGVWKMCVTKLLCDKVVVWQRWCVTKMACEKMACDNMWQLYFGVNQPRHVSYFLERCNRSHEWNTYVHVNSIVYIENTPRCPKPPGVGWKSRPKQRRRFKTCT